MESDSEIFYDKVIVPCAIIVNKENKVLVQSIKDNKKTEGLWEFPGGKARQNKSIVAELAREVQEEISIKLVEDKVKPVTFNVFKSSNGLEYIVMFFACYDWVGDVKPNENQDTLWVDIENIQTLPFLAQNKKVITEIARFLQH